MELVAKSGALGSVALPTAAPMQRVAIVRNAGDEVILEVTYAAAGESAQFGFSRSGVAELKPGESVLVRYGDGSKGVMAAEVRLEQTVGDWL